MNNKYIACGGNHSVVIKKDGTVVCWEIMNMDNVMFQLD
jgi:alpha-tubulin suppressor-like RCC1 family protein